MIIEIDKCISKFEAFGDNAELVGWLDEYAEAADDPIDRYNFRELGTHLEGLYDLCRSMRHHLEKVNRGLNP